MSDTATVLPHTLVVGLGKTGLSVVRHLRARGLAVSVIDSREAPPALPALRAEAPEVPVRTGGLDPQWLAGAEDIVLSPGLAPQGPFFDAARAQGLPLIGDIELFARAARAPVVGITGTNGKSTVTTLLGRMAQRAGRRARIGGNLGEPALELLDPGAELYVLELSSYQLDTTESLTLQAATVLNVTPDHLDRYDSVADYAASKARIFRRCGTAVLNADDPVVATMASLARRRLRFSLHAASGADYILRSHAGAQWLARGAERLLPLSELKLAGRHNAANALAALALGEALELPLTALLDELREFPGLPHRTAWVADIAGVRYIDDSKGTNVGATVAAVSGLTGPLVLIAGGDGKGQDFRPLGAALRGKVRRAVLIGRDARALGAALAGACEVEYGATLEAAVRAAAASARPGDTVLLSPACASLDMFRDYQHRGEVFAAAVRELAA
ncbi:MAG TPA: UDP-N-acetylmuramoyl-L-alanine--D-glutamate ligase [Steroidobacteraceae bacterium]|jgi:UDP-N-acetylmuramoylalanine--D-glutamate ligase|nr:UDP-N-acetylmuramoyl-L-alanine--D-glutamate ligase [Steroidobacteraceae bacterium]